MLFNRKKPQLMNAQEECAAVYAYRAALDTFWQEMLRLPRALGHLGKLLPGDVSALDVNALRVFDERGRTALTVLDKLQADAFLAHILPATDVVTFAAVLRLRGLRAAALRHRNALVERNIQLVHKVAQRYAFRGGAATGVGTQSVGSYNDLVQDGIFGLIDAANKFEPERGFRFSTCAVPWIKHHIQRGRANRSNTIRIPVRMSVARAKVFAATKRLRNSLNREPTLDELAAATGLSALQVQNIHDQGPISETSMTLPSGDEMRVASDAAGPDAAVSADGLREELETVISCLSDVQQDIIRRRMGFGTEPQTLKHVGEALGYTRERIRQLETEALERLNKLCRLKGVTL